MFEHCINFWEKICVVYGIIAIMFLIYAPVLIVFKIFHGYGSAVIVSILVIGASVGLLSGIQEILRRMIQGQ